MKEVVDFTATSVFLRVLQSPYRTSLAQPRTPYGVALVGV